MWLDAELTALARWVLEALALLLLAGMALFLALQYGGIPERVPSHFDYRGRPDRWAGRWVLFVVVAAALVSYLTLSHSGGTLRLIAGEVEPKPAEALLLAWVKLGSLGILAYAIWIMIRVSRGHADRLNLIVLALAVLALMAPAIVMDSR